MPWSVKVAVTMAAPKKSLIKYISQVAASLGSLVSEMPSVRAFELG